jgi:hypothetical protein
MIKTLRSLFLRVSLLKAGLLAGLLLVGTCISAQSIWTNPITGTDPGLTSPYSTGQTVDANLTVSGISRGPGITGNAGANRYNANNWSTGAIDLTDYFEFTLTPNTGFVLNLTSFVYTGQVSSGTPSFAFRSSLDGYAANIGTPVVGGTTIDLSSINYQNLSSTITFRFYVFNMAATTTTYSINDFTFNGTVVSTNTITVSSISQSSFTLANCSSTAPFTIDFTSTGTFTVGNNYTAQLSDATGSFATPVTIGTFASTANSGTINATIPAGTLTGANYRVRVVSNNPAVTSAAFGTALNITQNGYCASNATDYFRSRVSGNWATAATWQSSNDNVNWITATLAPTSAANTITIQNTHTVTIAAAASADQLTINTGGTLVHNNGVTFTLNDGTGTDMTVNGTYVINGTMPTATTATVIVNSGGIVRADSNTGGESDNFAFSGSMCSFLTGSIFQWNTNNAFETDNRTYFTSPTQKPIFRITQNQGTLGANTQTTINGLLELNGSLTLQSAGTKTFRDGIIGTGSLTQTNTSGTFFITANDAQLGGTGTIILNSVNGLQIASGATVTMISNKTVNGSTNDFTVANGGRLNCSTFVLSGDADFVLAAGGTLGIGSTNGINTTVASGNIQVTGYRYYSSDANYIFNGSANQSTGAFTTEPTPNRVNFFTVANTGAGGNNTVTLSSGNNNLTATILYLNNGLFAAGTGQNFNIVHTGSVYGNGGATTSDATAGTISFLGTGTTFGFNQSNPSLYYVILRNTVGGAYGGVNFNGTTSASATILNTLRLDAGSYVTQAPFYQANSNLIYNTGGVFGRNVEWGSASGQGYPHHVTVQGNTILDLNTNAIVPAQLSLAGDLTIGNTTGRGEVYLNNSMNKPLEVRGNLIIGNANAAANSSVLALSTTIGGDLWLHGNFTRYNNSFYTDNSRAIFFLGAANASVNTPNVTITPGVPTQNFSYAIINKSVASADLTLNCPVGITNELTLQSGTITSTNTNLLVMYDNSTVVGMNYGTLTSGGSDNSFVNGPMKKIGNDAFVFPVGKLYASNPLGGSPVGGHRLIAMSAPANTTDEFTAQFYVSNANLVGPIVAPAAPQLVWVSRCEYWRLEKNTPAAATVNVTLSWNASSNCNVSYVTNLSSLVIAGNTSTNYNATSYVTGSGNWNRYGATSTTGATGAGTITWNGVNAFGPFALGSINANDNPLPFELNAFRATGKKDRITLDWEVSKNDLQESYTIERSRDGRLFETVATVTATAARTASYALDDLKPFNGWNYYRLRARDKQDITASSSIIKIWWGKEAVMSVLPNPAKEKIVINLSDPSSIQQIQLVNSNGQLLQQFRAISFVNEVNVSSLQAGIYYIRLIGKNGAVTKTFVKQ